MVSKLSDDDGRAVDLILESRARQNAQPSPAAPYLQPNVQAAHQVLSLLNAMPEEAPKIDLVARIMEQINEVDQTISLPDLIAPNPLSAEVP